ncbi:hypothetical protein DID88_003046 [Monilinia fructigena]|uniref:Dienelactone hydrolase domain-containing protein n=1 Tax=Monilinia fructigena TaxID=38457 RepID=A0A395IEW0_9HELO|nr:hypothetical protein DID88_003046 [Monilinia fructigena]
MTQLSVACCEGTPVSLHGLEYKLTDVTGPANSTSGILLVHDIFGFWTQTLLGADVLSATKTSSSRAPQGVKVFVPDFFGPGNEADIAYWPADTDEKRHYILKVFREQAETGKNLKKLEGFMDVLKEIDEAKGVKNWGVAGYCWGTKVCVSFFKIHFLPREYENEDLADAGAKSDIVDPGPTAQTYDQWYMIDSTKPGSQRYKWMDAPSNGGRRLPNRARVVRDRREEAASVLQPSDVVRHVPKCKDENKENMRMILMSTSTSRPLRIKYMVGCLRWEI